MPKRIAIQYQNEISSMCMFLTLQPELLGNELKLYSYLVSVNTCKYSTYTCHTARGVRGLPTLQDLNLPAASQRFPNKLTKESGTFTSGLLGGGPESGGEFPSVMFAPPKKPRDAQKTTACLRQEADSQIVLDMLR